MTLSIFNDQSRVRQMMQLFNAMNMVFLAHHYVTKPKALLSEDGFGFAVALINFCSLKSNEPTLLSQTTQYMNIAKLGANFAVVSNRSSRLSIKANLLTTMLSFSNILCEFAGQVTKPTENTFIDDNIRENRLSAKFQRNLKQEKVFEYTYKTIITLMFAKNMGLYKAIVEKNALPELEDDDLNSQVAILK